MRLFVRTLQGLSYTVDDLDSTSTVADMKQILSDQHGISIDSQRIILCGQELLDHIVLSDTECQNVATLHCVTEPKVSAAILW